LVRLRSPKPAIPGSSPGCPARPGSQALSHRQAPPASRSGVAWFGAGGSWRRRPRTSRSQRGCSPSCCTGEPSRSRRAFPRGDRTRGRLGRSRTVGTRVKREVVEQEPRALLAKSLLPRSRPVHIAPLVGEVMVAVVRRLTRPAVRLALALRLPPPGKVRQRLELSASTALPHRGPMQLAPSDA
jgi:hypothetical protein